MQDGIDCRRLRNRFAAYLALDPEDGEEQGIRAHLAACPDCRADLGRFFLLECWEEGEAFPVRAPSGLVRSVIRGLEENKAGSSSSWNVKRNVKRSEGARPGRRIFRNYLAASLATFLLVFGGCFETLADLAFRTGRLREGIRAFDRGTRRIIEMSIEGPDALRRRIEFHLNERR